MATSIQTYTKLGEKECRNKGNTKFLQNLGEWVSLGIHCKPLVSAVNKFLRMFDKLVLPKVLPCIRSSSSLGASGFFDSRTLYVTPEISDRIESGRRYLRKLVNVILVLKYYYVHDAILWIKIAPQSIV